MLLLTYSFINKGWQIMDIFLTLMDFVGKAFVVLFCLYFGFILVSLLFSICVMAFKKRKSVDDLENVSEKPTPPNVINIDVTDKKDTDFYSAVDVLCTHKVSPFCEAFSDDIHKSIQIVNVTTDADTRSKHFAKLVTYFNIYAYEHLLDSRSPEKIKEFIKSKISMLTDENQLKIDKIGDAFMSHLDPVTVLFLTHYSMMTTDLRYSRLATYKGNSYFLPKIDKS